MTKAGKTKNKRILIFNVNWLGDVLFSTAAIRNIRYNFPDSYIACVIPPRCFAILRNNPHLNEIIVFDEKDQNKSILSKLGFVQFLKRKQFDTVFLLHRSSTRALLCRLAGIPERIGHYTKKRAFILTKSIHPPEKDSMHRIDYYLHIIKESGFKVKDRHPEFFFSDEDVKIIDNFLHKELDGAGDNRKAALLIGLNPGGNWIPKRWPVGYWAQLADKIAQEFRANIVITGSDSDKELAGEISKLMKKKPIIACGVFGLEQFAALCKRLDIFITADSGPLHIAHAVNTKNIIALFGPTSPKITGPIHDHSTVIIHKDVGCKIPCYVVDCGNNRCMQAITPDEVIANIRSIIK